MRLEAAGDRGRFTHHGRRVALCGYALSRDEHKGARGEVQALPCHKDSSHHQHSVVAWPHTRRETVSRALGMGVEVCWRVLEEVFVEKQAMRRESVSVYLARGWC